MRRKPLGGGTGQGRRRSRRSTWGSRCRSLMSLLSDASAAARARAVRIPNPRTVAPPRSRSGQRARPARGCAPRKQRARQDLNLRPSAPEADALSPELRARGGLTRLVEGGLVEKPDLGSSYQRNSCCIFSAGVFHSSVLRGRPLSSAAIRQVRLGAGREVWLRGGIAAVARWCSRSSRVARGSGDRRSRPGTPVWIVNRL